MRMSDSRSNQSRLVYGSACLLVVVTAALVAVAGCGHISSSQMRPGAQSVPDSQNRPSDSVSSMQNEFLGDSACESCHQSEFREHRHSRHASTLRTADQAHLAAFFPPAGRVLGSDIVMVNDKGNLAMKIAGIESNSFRLQLAFGSGKTGMTYTGLLKNTGMLELGRSYFPSARKWYLTPGHESAKSTDVGMPFDSRGARRCILCHATTLPDDKFIPEPRFMGVGCEACHGPGGRHVKTIKAGDLTHASMPSLGRNNVESIVELCGRCHRAEKSVAPDSLDAKMPQRFQSYALAKSRCFKESGGKLSCLTCHNPHRDAETDVKKQEAGCLKCHASGQGNGMGVGSAPLLAQARFCPVNPATGCIGCHMPRRRVFTRKDLPTTMADHYIRIYKPTTKSRLPRPAQPRAL